MLNGQPLPRVPPGVRKPCPLRSFTLAARSYRPSPTDRGWRAPASERSLPPPSFFLLPGGGCNSSDVRQAMRRALSGRPSQEVLPVALSQYLADLQLLDEIERHPRRTADADAAAWHFVGAAPTTSQYVAMLGLLGGQEGHAVRMGRLAGCLAKHRAQQARLPAGRRKPLYINIPTLDLESATSPSVMRELLLHDRTVAPVCLGVFDRSSAESGHTNKRYRALLNHSLVLPHVASPRLARAARRCALRAAADCAANASAPREGSIFHGDFGRFDFGARSAMRHMCAYMRTPCSLVSRMDMNRGVQGTKMPTIGRDGVASPSAAHHAEQLVTAHTSRAMLGASLCFNPQGDIKSSRRLFDALAAACAPVTIKAIGNSMREVLLANVPFHHSVDWREISFWYAPRGPTREEEPGTLRNLRCREEEAEWIDQIHDDRALVDRVRRNGQAAFLATMDLEFNPRGVVDALLQELPYVLDDYGIQLPARYMMRPDERIGEVRGETFYNYK